MSYPVSTSLNLRFEYKFEIPLNDQIARIIRSGFTYLDFNFCDWNADPRSPFAGPDWERWIDRAGELAAKMGAKFNQAHAPMDIDPRFKGHTQEEIQEFYLRAIRACAKLGIPWMVYHVNEENHPDWIARNLERFSPLMEESKKCGVGMAFENTWVIRQDVPLSRTEALIEFCDSWNDPMAGICWDTGHCNMTGGKPELRQYANQYTEIMKLGKRLKAVHIADNNGYYDDHILPFDGNINWDDVMRALRDVGYEHSFTYEAHGALRRLPESLVDEKIAYMKRLGDKLVAWVD